MHDAVTRQAVRKLRLAGQSYNEIAKQFRLSKSTLSLWLRDIRLSQRARKRLAERVHEASLRGLLNRNKNQTRLAQERAQAIRKLAKNEVTTLSAHDLKLVGISLYWAEGYKRPHFCRGRELTHHPVGFANSDPALIKLFLRFLREICKVSDDRIGAQVRLYEGMDERATLQFWQDVTCLPRDNFSKFYYGVSRSSLRKRPFNRLPYGTLYLRINDTKLYHRIMGWIEGLAQQVQ